MNNNHFNTEELFFNPNQDNFEGLLEHISPMNADTENDEIFSIELESSIDNTIEQLEKILKLELLSDDEWSELYATDAELHDDIEMLDFDSEY